MSVAAILAIVVATADVRDPATASMLAAATESLGRNVSIRLLGASQPGEVDPVGIERDLGASAVVTLVWTDASRLHARIRLHVAAGGRSTTRDIEFAVADTRLERSRTLGLTAASMWPEIVAAQRGEAPPQIIKAPPPTGPPAPPAAPVQIEPSQPDPSPPRQDDRRASGIPRVGIGIALIGASGSAGIVGELGGTLDGALAVGSSWSLRMALRVRWGPVSELRGHELVGALAGGAEWWPAFLRASSAARFGLRADALALRQQVTGSVGSDPTENHARLLPGLDLLALAALRVASHVELLAAAGGEGALGTTDIRVGRPPVPVATIPSVRLAAEVGLRVVF